MTLSALLLLAAASPAFAQEAAPAQDWIAPETLQKRADDLRDAVADRARPDAGLREDARAMFDRVPAESLAIPVYYRRVDRERVDGELGAVDKMLTTADERVEWWKRQYREEPPPVFEGARKQAAAMAEEKGRLQFDETGRMGENQMGTFRYLTDRLTGGVIRLNQKLALLATRIGQAFAYSTVVHEGKHARDREDGNLTPEQEVEGEVRAFKAQYQWLTIMDPRGERLVVLHSTLKLRLKRKPEDRVTAEAVEYLEHLGEVLETGGKDDKLRELVKRLGYKDRAGHRHHHGDGHDHEDEGRGANAPVSA